MATLAGLNPRFRLWAQWIYDVARQNGLRPVITSGYRSTQQQAALYAAYLRGEMPYTVAPPGRSKHERGLAVDIDLPQYPQARAQLGALWRRYGGRWYESDPVHFEAP